MNYRIVKKEAKHGKNVYHIELNGYSKEDRDRLLSEIDYPFGAPFGGSVEIRGEGLAVVEVYTD